MTRIDVEGVDAPNKLPPFFILHWNDELPVEAGALIVKVNVFDCVGAIASPEPSATWLKPHVAPVREAST